MNLLTPYFTRNAFIHCNITAIVVTTMIVIEEEGKCVLKKLIRKAHFKVHFMCSVKFLENSIWKLFQNYHICFRIFVINSSFQNVCHMLWETCS